MPPLIHLLLSLLLVLLPVPLLAAEQTDAPCAAAIGSTGCCGTTALPTSCCGDQCCLERADPVDGEATLPVEQHGDAVAATTSPQPILTAGVARTVTHRGAPPRTPKVPRFIVVRQLLI